jgi:peptide/nickel transport system ATP-binding protein
LLPLAEGMCPTPSSLSSEPPLVVSSLSVALRRGASIIQALHGVSFTLGAGEAVALVGETGAGKSVLLQAILGVLPDAARPRQSGAVHIAGRDAAVLASRRLALRDAVGVVFQDATLSLDPAMRVGRQLAERVRPGTDLPALLASAGLDTPKAVLLAYPHQLSAERRQRVMLARAMAPAPALLLLDAPTATLDRSAQAALLQTIAAIGARGSTTILFATDNFAVAATVARRALVLHAGRIVETGTMVDLLERPAHPYTAALLAARCDLAANRALRLQPLAGEPDLAAVGCAFRGRCPAGSPRCAQPPELGPAGRHGGLVACWNVNSASRRAAVPPRWAAMPPSSATPVLRMEGIGRSFPPRDRPFAGRANRRVALDDFTLSLGDRECVAIVGPNGSGKTTLLRIAAGLLRPSVGRRAYAGTVPPQMLFGDAIASLPPWLSVREIVGERLQRRGLSRVERDARVEEALALAQLPPEFIAASPRQLTAGQAQRVAIARALIVPPALLLCDEPAARLDVSVAAGVLNLLTSLRRSQRMALLFATDDIAVARYIADRIVVLNHGRIEQAGPAETVVAAPGSDFTRTLLAAAAEPAALPAREVA